MIDHRLVKSLVFVRLCYEQCPPQRFLCQDSLMRKAATAWASAAVALAALKAAGKLLHTASTRCNSSMRTFFHQHNRSQLDPAWQSSFATRHALCSGLLRLRPFLFLCVSFALWGQSAFWWAYIGPHGLYRVLFKMMCFTIMTPEHGTQLDQPVCTHHLCKGIL